MTTKTNELNDSIDDLFGISEAMNIIKPTPRTLPTDPQLVRVREMTPEFVEQCPKCRGSGRFTSWGGRSLGECFACKGRGKRSFKSSPDQRAHAAQARAALPSRRWEAFQQGHPEEAGWMLRKGGTFDFAAKMKDAVERYGNLTDGQMGAVQKCMARDRSFEERKQANIVAANERSAEVDVSKIIDAIRKGKEAGLKWITLRFNGIVITEAKKHPGVLYVLHSTKKDVEGRRLYLGKITGGRFLPVNACTPEDQAVVILVASDPAAAAKVFGNVTNSCCVCGRELTNKQSVEEGIGPICAGRVGWVKGGLRVQAVPSFSGDSRPDEF